MYCSRMGDVHVAPGSRSAILFWENMVVQLLLEFQYKVGSSRSTRYRVGLAPSAFVK